MDNATVKNCSASGIHTSSTRNISVTGSRLEDNVNGIYFSRNSQQFPVENVTSIENDYGLFVNGEGGAAAGKLVNFTAYNNSVRGIHQCHLLDYPNITGSNISGNGDFGFYSYGNVNRITIRDTYIQENEEFDVIMTAGGAAYCFWCKISPHPSEEFEGGVDGGCRENGILPAFQLFGLRHRRTAWNFDGLPWYFLFERLRNRIIDFLPDSPEDRVLCRVIYDEGQPYDYECEKPRDGKYHSRRQGEAKKCAADV